MWRVLELDHLGHLEVDKAVDEVVVEHAASLEEGAVLVELLERLTQAAAYGRDLLELGRWQIIEVLVDGRAGIELVLDAVETCHQHRGEAEIRIGHRIGETNL